METIYFKKGDTNEARAYAIAGILGGHSAKYLKRGSRNGWVTKHVSLRPCNKTVCVTFDNNVYQEYALSTFCNVFGFIPRPVDEKDKAGNYVTVKKSGGLIANHKTLRIAELAAVAHTERYQETVLIYKEVACTSPVVTCKAEVKYA